MMSWFDKIIPPKIKSAGLRDKSGVPEGLWQKCTSCEAVLYGTDLALNLHVCPKCGVHMRINATQRLDYFLDEDAPADKLGESFKPTDFLRFKDSRKYKERLSEAQKKTGNTDALSVKSGELKGLPIVAAAVCSSPPRG